MAEEPHPEELVPAEEPAETPGYKPPAKKTLEEITKLDEEDESLRKYKEQLLKGAEGAIKDPSKGPEMTPLKMTLISDGREDKEVDLTDLEALKKHSFVIKEGVEYKMKITFKVFNDIVCGLKYVQHTYKKGVPGFAVDKQKVMLGSYGPKTNEQDYTTAVQDAPKGVMGRGSYTIKSKFTDDDANDYASWTWNFEIKKDWEG